MIEFIGRLFRKDAPGDEGDGYIQVEREALIDVILLSMYADNHLAIEEQQLLTKKSRALHWAAQLPLQNYVSEATARVRAAMESGAKRKELLRSIQDRLYSPESRERAYELCQEVLISDGKKTDEEILFQEELRLYLGIGEEAPL
mgnify:CR=1 FL=1